MHRIEQYGFTLIPSPFISEEQYLLIKRHIETSCKIAQMCSKQFNIKNTNVAMNIEPNLFISLSLSDGQAYFGIYDSSKNEIHTTITVAQLKDLTEKDFAKFGTRCFRFFEAISQGRSLNLGKLNEAWTAYFESQLLQNKSQTITM